MPLDIGDFLIDQQHPTAEEREWMKDKQFILVTPENLDECIDACIESGRYAIDLETTGLDNRVANGRTVDTIAGVCLSPDGVRGYYIPLNHVKVDRAGNRTPRPCNIPMSVFDKAIRRLVKATEDGDTVGVYHNGKFDQEFLQFNPGEPWGEWDRATIWDDTMILAYLGNSRKRDKRLKSLSKELLDIEQVELKELYPEDHKGPMDFSVLDPEDQSVLWYGGGDAICTWLLYGVLAPAVIEPASDGRDQKLVYSIERTCIASTRWMERNRIYIDRDRVMELIHLGQQEWYDSIMEVYEEANKILGRDVMPGYYKALQTFFVADDPKSFIPRMLERAKALAKAKYPDSQEKIKGRANKEWPPIYDVNAPKQLGVMFDEMGVPGLKRTEKSNQVKTSKDELKRVITTAGAKFPFMAKIQRFRETQKALSSYLYPMYLDSDRSNDSMRINFQGAKVDTGRFSTPSKNAARGRLAGWPQVNLQSIPATYDPHRPACMTRLRECIIARPSKEGEPPRYIVAIDYAGVELRIVTNLSREPKWMNEFFHCANCDRTFDVERSSDPPVAPPPRCPNCGSDKIGDLHTLSALEIYGQDAQSRDNWKALRGYAKCVHPDTLIGTHVPHVPTGMGETSVWGVRPIGDLEFGTPGEFRATDHTINVWAGNRTPFDQCVPVKETYHGGDKELFHVVTRRGIVTCSDAHGFKLTDGEVVSIKEGLAEGAILEEPVEPPPLSGTGWLPCPYRPFPGVPEVHIPTNRRMAYLAGAIVGDGAKAGKTSIHISHGALGKIDRTGTPYAEWQDLLLGALKDSGFDPTPRKKSVYLGSRHVMRFLTALGFLTGPDGSKILRIPSWVLAAGRDGILPFFGGLFDTDGTVNKRDASLSVTTKDAVFAGQIAAVLHTLRFVPHVEACWNKTYEKWYYRIRVRAGDAVEVGRFMRHPGKKARLQSKRFLRSMPNKVVKIIPAGSGPCVDVHLDSTDHLYWCNGLLTHNSTNFALSYGGGGSAVTRATGVDKNEGWRIKHQFDRTYSGLKRWWKSQHDFARKHEFVRTAFGRKYPVPDINHADGGFRSKAERNSVNGPIQGTSADITKTAMALVYKECKKRGWLDKCALIITMHDELVFDISADILEEAIAVLVPIMADNSFIKLMKWPIPLTCDVEIGHDWTVPWDLNSMRHGEVRFVGNDKYTEKMAAKGKLPDGAVWENMDKWPDELKPWFAEAQGNAPVVPEPSPPKATPPADPEPSEPPPDAGAIGITAAALPDVSTDGDFRYTLKVPLTIGLLPKLAETIVTCRGGGTQNLRLFSQEGKELVGWKEEIGVESVYVNPTEFKVLARRHKI